jgi:subtilisin family serine protease
MKTTLTFILSLFAAITFGQIPDNYSRTKINEVLEQYERLKDSFDVVIPPIERLPVAPSFYSLSAAGNWGAEWTGSSKHYWQVHDRAKRPVVVFIFDTAPYFDHPALEKFAWNQEGKSYTGEPELKDGQGHGHHVAGIIGGISSTYEIGIGRALVDAEKLHGIPIEVLNDHGSGSFSVIQRAIKEANLYAKQLIAQGYFVVYNMSLGGPVTHSGTASAIKEAEQIGVFVCVAAGNTSREGIEFPGRADGAHAIGSINNDGRRSSFSTYGDGLYMSAPGRNILSTWLDGQFVELSGTSMATPTQAALVAIAASLYPDLDRAGIEKLLIEIATDIDKAGYDKFTGHGYDYVGKILEYEAEEPTEPEPEPERPEKKSRYIDVVLPGPYTGVYQRSGGIFIPFEVRNAVIRAKTALYSEDAHTEVADFVRLYFHNRGFVLFEDSDFLDAGYWSGRFLEIISKQAGMSLEVVDMCVVSEAGQIGKPTRPSFWQLMKKNRLSSLTY